MTSVFRKAFSCFIMLQSAPRCALNTKKKPKALTYAEKGLAACETLERSNPNSPQLQMRDNLQKTKWKASRKFF